MESYIEKKLRGTISPSSIPLVLKYLNFTDNNFEGSLHFTQLPDFQEKITSVRMGLRAQLTLDKLQRLEFKKTR